MNILSSRKDFPNMDIEMLCTEAVNASAYLWITSNEIKPEVFIYFILYFSIYLTQ